MSQSQPSPEECAEYAVINLVAAIAATDEWERDHRLMVADLDLQSAGEAKLAKLVDDVRNGVVPHTSGRWTLAHIIFVLTLKYKLAVEQQ